MKSESHTYEWLPLNRVASATAAAASLRKKLAAQGRDIIDLGQGREQIELPLAVSTFAQIGPIVVNSDYNEPPVACNKAVSDWIGRILHIDTPPNTTFSIQRGGRNGVDIAFNVLGRRAREHTPSPSTPKILMPDSSWPMIGELLGDSALGAAFYSMIRGRYAEHIEQQLTAYGDDIVGLYLNSPHNPTGLILSEQDISQIFDLLNRYNSGEALERRNGRKIAIIMDAPYPHACPQITQDKARHLDTGYRPFHQNQTTPWIVPVSASKFFGMARPGFSMLATHHELSPAITGRIMRDGGCTGHAPEVFNAITHIVAPDNDTKILDHFTTLRTKYVENCKTLQATFPDQIVDGDPGMIRMIQVDLRDYLNRTMIRPDGSQFTIQDGDDVIEYIANTQEVVAVSQGHAQTAGLHLFRFSTAEEPPRFTQGILRFKEGLENINPMPSRAIAAVNPTAPHPNAPL